MIYLSLILSLPLLYLTPWWSVAVLGAFLALLSASRWKIALGSALAAFAVALIRDGQSHDLITKRVSGLFGFAHAFWVFVFMMLLVFLTTLAGTYLAPNWGRPRKL